MASRKAKRIVITSALVAVLVVSAVLLVVRLRPEAAITKCLVSTYSSDDRMNDLPRVILWAWERPEDLRFINPQEIGVAYLAATITLSGDRVAIRPRLQPLALAPATRRIAVARIETDNRTRPLFSDEQRRRVVAALTALSQGEEVAAVQIDFDARASERTFYRALLVDLRNELPVTTRLSITALASWCLGDNWIADLPIDEAVPMLFRMGSVNQPYLHLAQSRSDARQECRGALGVSVDEPRSVDAVRRRIYIFNPRPWTALTIADARREALR